jgi:hypothetical protein
MVLGEPLDAWCYHPLEMMRAFVFGIDWLRNGIPIAKETSVLQDQADAVAEAMRRAAYVMERHPGSEPDSFRLTDPTGRIRGVFFLRMVDTLGASERLPEPDK